MKKLLFLIPIVIIGFMIWQSAGSTDDYLSEIEEFRKEKHDFFRTSEGSPFVQKNLEYKPVTFFPADPSYKVNATLTRLTTREVLNLVNSDGSSTNYLKFAVANFKLKGTDQSLVILKALGFGNQYLLAFVDETSAMTTYGGGRYLDVEISNSDNIILDFNKAYNPYCAYSEDFLCPLPPRENMLTVAIEAGEKDYKIE